MSESKKESVASFIANFVNQNLKLGLNADQPDFSQAAKLDSFLLVDLIVKLEAQFQIHFDGEDFISGKLQSLESIARLAEQKKSST